MSLSSTFMFLSSTNQLVSFISQPERRAADQSVNGNCNHLEKPVAIVVDTTVVTSDPKTKINPQYFPDVVQQIQPVLA